MEIICTQENAQHYLNILEDEGWVYQGSWEDPSHKLNFYYWNRESKQEVYLIVV